METAPEAFYDEYGEKEWDRAHKNFVHALEFENTKKVLEQELPDNGKILDAGGGSGRYTVWLAEKGYDVTLMDLSQEQLNIAKEKLEERRLRDKVEIVKGDIRDFEFEDEVFDAVLCLGGPLSHLLEASERSKAVSELARVAKRNAPVVASVMSFHGIMLLSSRETWGYIFHFDDFRERQKYDEQFRDKEGSDPKFADTYFFKEEQLRELMEGGGLEVQKVVGLEAVASIWDKRAEGLSRREKESLKKVSHSYVEEEASPALSLHMLAVARRI